MSEREIALSRGSRLLKDWLSRPESPSQAHFAIEVDVSQSAVSNFVRGYHRPSLATACLIQARTSGAVVVTDWLDDDEASKHSSLERAAG
jgi:transcriptional regulator with XRE-family HTH domain